MADCDPPPITLHPYAALPDATFLWARLLQHCLAHPPLLYKSEPPANEMTRCSAMRHHRYTEYLHFHFKSETRTVEKPLQSFNDYTGSDHRSTSKEYDCH